MLDARPAGLVPLLAGVIISPLLGEGDNTIVIAPPRFSLQLARLTSTRARSTLLTPATSTPSHLSGALTWQVLIFGFVLCLFCGPV